jgi:glycosyltransferase involved in cell wall biosynthesis
MSCFEDLLARDTGGSVRIYNLAVNLAKLGHKVRIIIPGLKDENIEISDDVIIYRLRGLSPISLLKIFSGLLGAEKFTSFFFYDPFFISKSYRIFLRSQVIQLEQPWAGGILVPLLKTSSKRLVVIDSHDVLQSLRLQHVNLLRRFLETFLEKVIYNLADIVFVVSGKEKELLAKIGILKEKIFVLPNGVDTNLYSRTYDSKSCIKEKQELSKFLKVVFVGNMEYFPNQEAVHIIASKIAPKVRKSVENVKFLIVGRCPKKLRIVSPDLVYTGIVENIVEYLNISDLAIAPLLHGSGTRLKILEYFSCGLPVVSTSIGCEGLEVKNRENIIIEDDIDSFITRTVELLQDKELRSRIGSFARELAVGRYDWRRIVKEMDEAYSKSIL